MIAYAYDTNGYYLGTINLQPSPLQPGVFFDQPNSTKVQPPPCKDNEVLYWSGNSWEIKPDYSGKKYYSKSNRSEKTFERGEEFDSNYTDVFPLENESFQKWSESSNSWVIDEEAKTNQELLIRKSQIKRLLLESDYIELPSFLERKGVDVYNQWMTYRSDLRSAYHDPSLPIPEKPE